MERVALRIREAIALGTSAGLLVIGCHSQRGDSTADAASPQVAASASVALGTASPAEPVDPTITVNAGHPGGFHQCRTLDGAAASAIGPARDNPTGCPTSLGDRSQRPPWAGSFDASWTKDQRARRNGSDECCYSMAGNWGNRGRPFIDDDGHAVLAGIQGDPRGEPSAAESFELAERWLADARAEHASIASFARSVLELMAVGAPLDILEANQRALADEIRHARACLDLAEQCAGKSFAFGPLPALAPRGGGRRRVALDTFDEGCVSETISAIEAARAVEACTSATTRAVLEGIAEDEASHAALAWRTLAWLLAVDGSRELRSELRARAAQRRASSGADAMTAWEKVIAPSLAELLDSCVAGAPGRPLAT
jgi:hypothetical protein